MRSSRILLGLGLLVAVAAALFAFILLSGGDRVGQSGPPPTPTPEDVPVFAARRDLQSGTIISDTDDLFKTLPIPASDFAQGSYFRPEQASQLVGKKLLSSVSQNQPLQEEQVGPLGLAERIPQGNRAYPIKVNALSGVGDLISEGDRVDVIVSFPINLTYIRPGIREGETEAAAAELTLKEDTFSDNSTKTLLQDVQVLRVLHRPVPRAGSGTPQAGQEAGQQPQQTPGAARPMEPTPIPGIEPHRTVMETALQPGEFLLVLALTDQQAEVIKYSTDKGGILNLALRPTGDREVVTTTGLTFDILARDYGLPIPRPLELLQTELQGAQETPVIPTPEPAATPTP